MATSFRLDLEEGAWLERIETRDAEAVWQLIEIERERLDAHDSWAAPLRSRDTVVGFIGALRASDAANERVTALIRRDGEVVGIVGLRDIDAENLSAALWIWIAATNEGQGLAARASLAALRYGFEALGLERVTYVCDSRNARSRRLAVRVGFRPEGVLASAAILADDTVVDHVSHGLTRAEWPRAAAVAERSVVRRARGGDAPLLRKLGVTGPARLVWVLAEGAAVGATSPEGGVARLAFVRHVGGASLVEDLAYLTRVASADLACEGARQIVLADPRPSLPASERVAQGWVDVGEVWVRSFLELPASRALPPAAPPPRPKKRRAK